MHSDLFLTRRVALSSAAISLLGASALVASGIPVGAAGLKFSDVPATAAFYTEIMWVAERGIISGFADGTFRPLALMNRGSMAATLHKLAGSPSYTAPRTSYFQDVPLSHPFFKQISWMVDSGVTYGWGDGSFRPGDPLTRDAVAAFLYRMAGSPGYIAPSVSPYTDIGPGSAYYKGMCWMASMGISKGWPGGTLRPVESVQRNALCAFLYRYRKNAATASWHEPGGLRLAYLVVPSRVPAGPLRAWPHGMVTVERIN